MGFKKLKKEFKLVGMKNSGAFADFGKEVPRSARQFLKRVDEIKNHTEKEITLYEPKRKEAHMEGRYYVGLIVDGILDVVPPGMEYIEVSGDYINVRGLITDINTLHFSLLKWGEEQGYKRNLDSYIVETYHSIENSEEEVEIYLPIHSY
ncbi:effector binding domain-containing protein [Bacillus sp. FJAT-22090]|uniref:effector binding domain-containing protein n=1 Tax=Bacillus sp. FJAT-22090 TaxID=1581038 RepID=UPI0011A54181|nr:effector binding domain-containing protein [Bacillus sp. FJAT-22090]